MPEVNDSDLPEFLKHLLADAPTQTVLPNGLTVIHQHLPEHDVVSAQVWVRSGSIHEHPFLGCGLSHFLEHMLFKGSAKRTAGQIASEVQAFGGSINAYTSFDRTVYYIDGPSEALLQSLDILADMTLQATLPEDEVAREKEVILREIDMTLDDPDRTLIRSVFSTAYTQHPFRFPVIGLGPLFKEITREDLLGYYQRRYQPHNMVLSVAGNIAEGPLMEAVERTFGQSPHGRQHHALVPAEPAQLARRTLRVERTVEVVRGILAYKIPSMRDATAPGLDVIAAVLGSGQSAVLRQKFHEEEGLVDDIAASAWNPADPGLFIVRYQTRPDKAEAAEAGLQQYLSSEAPQAFTREGLEKARRFAMVSEVHSRQTASGRASRQGLLSAIVGDPAYPETFFRRLQSLKVEDLKELAEATFTEDLCTTVSLHPKGRKTGGGRAKTAARLPDFEELTLANGARILWQRDARLPRAYLRYCGLGGCMYEPASSRGSTSLLATLMARDTKRHSAREVATRLENEGGFLVDGSGNNTFALAAEVLPGNALQGLGFLRDAVLSPAFIPSTFERERDAQLSHLHALHDEIVDHGRLALRKAFYGDHPFASDPCGALATCRNITLEDIRDLYRKVVCAPNAVFVAAGDIDPDSLLPEIEHFLSELPASPFAKRLDSFKGPSAHGRKCVPFEREQSVIFEAYPDTGITSEEDPIAELLDEMLSDMSGALFKSVREDRALAYFVGASRILAPSHGIFYLYAGTHPTKCEEVFACFRQELDRFRSGKVTPEEIDAARARLKVQNRFALQSPSTRATRASLNALYGKPVMDWLHFESRLDAITPDNLSAFCRTHLAPGNALQLVIGPESS